VNPYRDLDDAYQRLALRPQHRTSPGGRKLDAIVATIRDDTPDSGRSDQTLRSLIAAGRTDPDALTVVLYALAPELRARLSRDRHRRVQHPRARRPRARHPRQ